VPSKHISHIVLSGDVLGHHHVVSHELSALVESDINVLGVAAGDGVLQVSDAPRTVTVDDDRSLSAHHLIQRLLKPSQEHAGLPDGRPHTPRPPCL
jgi:hypothetical protein